MLQLRIRRQARRFTVVKPPVGAVGVPRIADDGVAGQYHWRHSANIYYLGPAEAIEVSDHLPVWAEFNVTEGGQPGRLAGRPQSSPR